MSVDQVIKILGQPDTIKYGKTKDLLENDKVKKVYLGETFKL